MSKRLNLRTHEADVAKNAHGCHFTGELSVIRLVWVVLLNMSVTLAEIAGGIFSGSLALVSDAVHNAGDTAAVVASFVARRIAQKPSDKTHRYGYRRAEIIAAFLNSAVLLAVFSSIAIEALRRLISFLPIEGLAVVETALPIEGSVMMKTALAVFAAKAVSAVLLHRDAGHSLNIRAGYLHFLADTVSSLGVVAGGFFIWKFDIFWIDPLISFSIAVYVLAEAFKVVKTTLGIFMQAAPPLDYDAITDDIKSIAGVVDVGSLNAWRGDESTVFFEARITLADMPLSQADVLRDEMQKLLEENHSIKNATLQFEAATAVRAHSPAC